MTPAEARAVPAGERSMLAGVMLDLVDSHQAVLAEGSLPFTVIVSPIGGSSLEVVVRASDLLPCLPPKVPNPNTTRGLTP